MLCPNCNSNAVLGFVHSDGKHEGKQCLKCGQIVELNEMRPTPMGDWENAILARQEEDYL